MKDVSTRPYPKCNGGVTKAQYVQIDVDSDNGLVLVRRKAIIWTSAVLWDICKQISVTFE